MDWKEVLKPTIGKVFIFVILALLVWLFAIFSGGEYLSRGFPFLYFEWFGSQIEYGHSTIHYINLIGDILFWYLVSCGIVVLYKKYRN